MDNFMNSIKNRNDTFNTIYPTDEFGPLNNDAAPEEDFIIKPISYQNYLHIEDTMSTSNLSD